MTKCLNFHEKAIADSGADEGVPEHAKEVANAFQKLENWIPPNIPDLDDDLNFAGDVVFEGAVTYEGDGPITYEGPVTFEVSPYTATAPWIDITDSVISHGKTAAGGDTLSDGDKVIKTLSRDAQNHIFGATYVDLPAAGGSESGYYIEDYTGVSPHIVIDNDARTIAHGNPDTGSYTRRIYDKDGATLLATITTDSLGHVTTVTVEYGPDA